jgi:hypothetical protein
MLVGERGSDWTWGAGGDPIVSQLLEVSEGENQEEELQECLDHHPNSFEKGKLGSILSLPNFR